MQGRRCIRGIALAGFLGMVVPLLAACAGGVSQAEYDAVKQQLAAKEQEAASLRQRLGTGEGTGTGPAAQALRQQLAAKEQELADLKKRTMWTSIANVPPRATPTPLPPGARPPAPPQPPAARTVPLYFYVDTVTPGPGESKFNVDGSRYCIKSSIFPRGIHIVWRMEIVDTSTGKILQTPDIKEAVLRLPHGEQINFRYGRHGTTDDAPWFWTAVWDVPMDYPLGALDYSIRLTSQDGKSVTVGDPLAVRRPNFQPGIDLDTRVVIVP